MGWLAAKMGRTSGTGTGGIPTEASCAHETLSPRWRDPAAMGECAEPMGYLCHRCHAEFLPYLVRDGRVIAVR